MENSDLTVYCVGGINPEPWEASQGHIGKKNGKSFIGFHKPDGLRSYQEALADEFPKANPHVRIHRDDIRITFHFWRQVAEYELFTDTKTKKRSANYADATNLQKATEDALQGILYSNDRTNLDIRSRIEAQGPDITPFILIFIEPIDKDESRYAEWWRNELEQEIVPTTDQVHMDRKEVDDLF